MLRLCMHVEYAYMSIYYQAYAPTLCSYKRVSCVPLTSLVVFWPLCRVPLVLFVFLLTHYFLPVLAQPVKVCDAAIRKPLLEFEATSNPQFTVDQVNELPPSADFPGGEEEDDGDDDESGGGGGGGGAVSGGGRDKRFIYSSSHSEPFANPNRTVGSRWFRRAAVIAASSGVLFFHLVSPVVLLSSPLALRHFLFCRSPSHCGTATRCFEPTAKKTLFVHCRMFSPCFPLLFVKTDLFSRRD